ncbi:MAG: hypothetical protein HY791_03195 [Deltaproteobacteria bacterium]|nr:hypothetical protein [Deltaproteobacteria bacterium]
MNGEKLVALFALGVLAQACSEDGKTCGAGTTEMEGSCVPSITTCAAGTRQEGSTCVSTAPAQVTCGAGTRLAGTSCVDDAPDLMCGEGTTLDGDVCKVEVVPPTPPGIDGMKAYACKSERCSASLAVEYWQKVVGTIDGSSWATHAIARTVTFVEVGGTSKGGTQTFESLSFRVTDAAGGSWDCAGGEPCAGLDFEAGRPVTLKLVNPANALSGHYLTAAPFFRKVAWRKVETPDGEYKAPAFDAVEVKAAATELEATLYFVPLIAGDYQAYCQIRVTGGGSYAAILDGTTTPNYATGHAGDGMHAMIRVTDSAGTFANHSLNQDMLANRDPALDSDPRTAGSWWTDPVRNEGKCCTDLEVQLADVSDEQFEFRLGSAPVDDVNPIELVKDRGYKLKLTNTSPTQKHYFTSPQFFERAVMRKVEDTHAEIKAPYLFELEVLPNKSATVFLIPTVAARYGTWCSRDVRQTGLGPDFGTGHAAKGMRGPLLVLTSSTSTTS